MRRPDHGVGVNTVLQCVGVVVNSALQCVGVVVNGTLVVPQGHDHLLDPLQLDAFLEREGGESRVVCPYMVIITI